MSLATQTTTLMISMAKNMAKSTSTWLRTAVSMSSLRSSTPSRLVAAWPWSLDSSEAFSRLVSRLSTVSNWALSQQWLVSKVDISSRLRNSMFLLVLPVRLVDSFSIAITRASSLLSIVVFVPLPLVSSLTISFRVGLTSALTMFGGTALLRLVIRILGLAVLFLLWSKTQTEKIPPSSLVTVMLQNLTTSTMNSFTSQFWFLSTKYESSGSQFIRIMGRFIFVVVMRLLYSLTQFKSTSCLYFAKWQQTESDCGSQWGTIIVVNFRIFATKVQATKPRLQIAFWFVSFKPYAYFFQYFQQSQDVMKIQFKPTVPFHFLYPRYLSTVSGSGRPDYFVSSLIQENIISGLHFGFDQSLLINAFDPQPQISKFKKSGRRQKNLSHRSFILMDATFTSSVTGLQLWTISLTFLLSVDELSSDSSQSVTYQLESPIAQFMLASPGREQKKRGSLDGLASTFIPYQPIEFKFRVFEAKIGSQQPMSTQKPFGMSWKNRYSYTPY